jgi:hypothetical protein
VCSDFLTLFIYCAQILKKLRREPYTPANWAECPLHPRPSLHPRSFIANFIFVVSVLNFSFWSEEGYAVEYKDGVDGKGSEGNEKKKLWTGYWSMLAALHRGNAIYTA